MNNYVTLSGDLFKIKKLTLETLFSGSKYKAQQKLNILNDTNNQLRADLEHLKNEMQEANQIMPDEIKNITKINEYVMARFRALRKKFEKQLH